MFIILGIGADDIYVVIEFWRQARYEAVGPAAEADVFGEFQICKGDGVTGALVGGGGVAGVEPTIHTTITRLNSSVLTVHHR